MLILLRHGRTEANARGLLLGRADPALDELGRRQAVRAAAAIGAVDTVISSPLRRCTETAAAFGSDVVVDESWVELDYGEWDQQPVADVAAETWSEWRADPEFAPPGGESLAAVDRRVHPACARLIDRARHERIVVVSHVSPIKSAVAWALDGGPEVSWRVFLEPASMTTIAAGPFGPSLRKLNATGHVDDLEEG